MKIFLLLLIVVMIAIAVTRWQGGKYADFKLTAKTVQATVTLRDERENRQNNRRKEKNIEYRFLLAGREYTGHDTVEYDDLWQQLLLGDSISVYYDPKNPAQNIPAALLDRRLNIAEKID